MEMKVQPKDYSQWGEQELITKFFGGFIGRFLDLGASDGVTGSNTRGLFDLGWSGVCVEASPFAFQKLIENYRGADRVECVCAAVMGSCGITSIDDSDDQTATCATHPDQSIVKRHYGIGCATPGQISVRYGVFDFVSFDLEGVDLGVIQASDYLLRGARLVCFEDAMPYRAFDKAYHGAILEALARMGFRRIIGTTTDASKSGNTLVAR